MHTYRSHTCGALRLSDEGQTVTLSGWIHRIRDHGGVLFIDLRDTHGLTQCVVNQDSPVLADANNQMMGSPSEPTPEQLRDLHIKVAEPKAKIQATG